MRRVCQKVVFVNSLKPLRRPSPVLAGGKPAGLGCSRGMPLDEVEDYSYPDEKSLAGARLFCLDDWT